MVRFIQPNFVPGDTDDAQKAERQQDQYNDKIG
jgi:hypothetical protein